MAAIRRRPAARAHAAEPLHVFNKRDLAPDHALPAGALALSAQTGAGLDALREALLDGAAGAGDVGVDGCEEERPGRDRNERDGCKRHGEQHEQHFIDEGPDEDESEVDNTIVPPG